MKHASPAEPRWACCDVTRKSVYSLCVPYASSLHPLKRTPALKVHYIIAQGMLYVPITTICKYSVLLEMKTSPMMQTKN